MSSEDYVKQAVSDVETELQKVDKCLPTRVGTPLSQGYRPELDGSAELDAIRGQYYQSLIGVLRFYNSGVNTLGNAAVVPTYLSTNSYVGFC
jgi:hypothetical protein